MIDIPDLSRRMLLRGLAVAPLAAAPPALARAVAPPPVPSLLDYVTWLAHEHRAALCAYCDAESPHSAPHHWTRTPYCWVPDDPAIEALVASGSPLERAGPVLAAARLHRGL